jgi:hypothetical protein
MEAIIVALIGVVGSILVVMLEKTRKENREDHNVLATTVNRIEQKLDDHMRDHAFSEMAKRVRRKEMNRGA